MRADLIQELRRAGLLANGANPVVTPLTGGYWNENCRLRDPGIDWVVKHYHAGTGASLFPVLPDAEARALEFLRGRGIGPDLVAYFRTTDGDPILVYRYWPGAPWREDVVPVAGLLRALHTVPLKDAGEFRRLPTSPEEILAQGDDLLGGAGEGALAARVRALRPDPVEPNFPDRLSLVHTDVGAGNLIVGEGGIRLIDWQCPGIGDPAEDLWAFLSPAFQILFSHAPLTSAEREAFLNAYGDAETVRRVSCLSPSFGYRMAAYCCLRQQDLAVRDPALSERYRQAGEAEIGELGEGAGLGGNARKQ